MKSAYKIRLRYFKILLKVDDKDKLSKKVKILLLVANRIFSLQIICASQKIANKTSTFTLQIQKA